MIETTIQNNTHTSEAAANGSVRVLRKRDWALAGFVERVGTEWHASFPGGVSNHTSRVAAFEAVAAADNADQAVAAGLEPVDEAKAILRDLAASTELRAILDRLNASSRKLDDSGDWNSTTGHRIDSAMGYLRMALEAAEGR
jgi:hypothetical protein